LTAKHAEDLELARRWVAPAFLLVLLWGAAAGVGLGSYPLIDPDEGRNAGSSAWATIGWIAVLLGLLTKGPVALLWPLLVCLPYAAALPPRSVLVFRRGDQVLRQRAAAGGFTLLGESGDLAAWARGCVPAP
jgi:hypothetical protein